MLLGKRSRPTSSMKRTMSMTELNFDLNHSGASEEAPSESHDSSDVGCGDGTDKRLLRGGRKSCDLGQTTSMAHFLRACGLCKRRLVPGRDIYMYRGDGAYCSLECRQQQMNVDEKKEKFALMASSSNNVEAPSAAALPVSAAGGETVAAL